MPEDDKNSELIKSRKRRQTVERMVREQKDKEELKKRSGESKG